MSEASEEIQRLTLEKLQREEKARLARNRGAKMAAVAVLSTFFACGACVVAVVTQEPSPEDLARRSEEARCGDAGGARVVARNFVEDNLRTPGTAEFGWPSEDDTWQTDCGLWFSRGTVDAQNGFGALVRAQYFATVQKKEAVDSWSLVDLKIKERE
jgi:hypothetical protein